jgi:hypothetical protein
MGSTPENMAQAGFSREGSSARRRLLLGAVGGLSGKCTVDELVQTLRYTARYLAGADGITVVHREGNEVRFVAEDAIGLPLEGRKFPIESCIPGLAILKNELILVPDIYADDRVPVATPTFVRSAAMFPIGMTDPIWALGAYWGTAGPIDPESVTLLSSLARSSASAFRRATRPDADHNGEGRANI